MIVGNWLTGIGVMVVGAASMVAVQLHRRTAVVRRLDGARLSEPSRGLHLSPPGALVHWVHRTGWSVPSEQILPAIICAGIAAAVVGFSVAGPPGAVAGVIGIFGLVAVVLWSLRHRRMRLLVKALPEGLSAVSRSVRSGASLTVAVEEAQRSVDEPLAAEFAEISRRVSLGQPVAAAFDAFASTSQLPDVRLVAAALGFCVDAGGREARALDGLVASLRDRQALQQEVAALASQARLSSMVLGLLPLGFVVLSFAGDRRSADVLLHTRLGQVCLAIGLILQGVGFLWMRWLMRGMQ